MENSTVFSNLKRICADRGVSVSSVEHTLHHGDGYPIGLLDVFANETDLRTIAHFLGSPLSRLVEGCESRWDLYVRAVFEESYHQLQLSGHRLVPRERAWLRIRESIEGHNFSASGLRKDMPLLIDGLAGPGPCAREGCKLPDCDCVTRCDATGHRMDAAG